MALARRANDDGSSCYPSVEQLAEDARAKRSTVQRSIPILEREGMLTVLHRGGRGRGDFSKYQLHPSAIKKGRNGNPFGEREKGSNEEKKGQQRGTKKGRNGDPDSVIYSINDSTRPRVANGDTRSGDGASARMRKLKNPDNKAVQTKRPANPEVVETHLAKMRETLGIKKLRET